MVLFEVMLALVIFTMVGFSLVVALSNSMDGAQKRNEIDAVIRGLENQLTMLHAGRVNPIEKDLDKDSYGIAYHLKIEPENLKDQKGQMVIGIYRVTITAKWKSGRQDEDRSIDELIYQP